MARIQRRTTGFMLMELLVVMAIIATLVMVFLPAVQHAREAARRATCKNNLKQIGLAMHNYADLHGTFPPGYTYRLDPIDNSNGAGFGWGTAILPFMDQAPMYEQFDFTVPLWDANNATPRVVRIATYNCPSSGISENEDFQLNFGMEQYGTSNYVANFGPGDMQSDPGDRRGVFSRNSSVSSHQIGDGTSHTFMVAERCNDLPNEKALNLNSGAFETIWSGAVRRIANPEDDNARFVLFQAGNVANSPQCDNRDARSGHLSGSNMLMGDGTVRFINSAMSLPIYRAMSTKDGGEMDARF